MASGFGINGGIGRCYPFFAQMRQCTVSRYIFILAMAYVLTPTLINYTARSR